jgi:ferritin-like protein
MASESLHEAREDLSQATIDAHRAFVSLMEELEAADWYQQRADACEDADLKAILEHNGNEELEHASMLLEWLRRHRPVFDEHLRRYLFKSGDIVANEEAATNGDDATKSGLAIGDLRKVLKR